MIEVVVLLEPWMEHGGSRSSICSRPDRITLNVRYDWPESDWQKVYAVCQTMPGWQLGQAVPSWFGGENDAPYIVASIEPSGLRLEVSDLTLRPVAAPHRNRA